jgi:hypothetical protein
LNKKDNAGVRKLGNQLLDYGAGARTQSLVIQEDDMREQVLGSPGRQVRLGDPIETVFARAACERISDLVAEPFFRADK